MIMNQKVLVGSLFLVIILLAGQVWATTYTSVADGDWSNGATWDIGSVPGVGDNVVIDGEDVTIDQDVNLGTGSFTITSGSATTNTSCTEFKAGSMSLGGGTVDFTASNPALKIRDSISITGATVSFGNNSIKRVASYTDWVSHGVKGSLTISSGVFNLDGTLEIHYEDKYSRQR